MTLNRRDLLKAGLASLPLGALSAPLSALSRAVAGKPAIDAKRLLTIYLRGGADGLNMVIPHEDPDYLVFRPGIGFEPPSGTTNPSISLPGYPALALHPDMAQIKAINPRSVAYLHRVGNLTAERSHFTEQHLTETGSVTYRATDSGWVPQLIGQGMPNSLLQGVTLGKRPARLHVSSDLVHGPNSVHLQTPYSSASGAGSRDLTIQYGAGAPGTPGRDIRDAVLDTVQNGNPGYPQHADSALLRSTIESASLSLEQLRAQLPSFTHNPEYPAVGDPAPAGSNLTAQEIQQYASFYARLEEAVQLLKIQNSGTPLANIVGVDLGGWDHHSGESPKLATLLRVLSQGLLAAFNDLDADNEPFLILVLSEFGRTIKENGSSGTDHGVGGLMIAIGDVVNEGVYNAHSPLWTPPVNPVLNLGHAWVPLNTQFNHPTYTDALNPATDFRVPFIEIAESYFGINVASLPSIGAEWDAVKLSTAPEAQLLGFV